MYRRRNLRKGLFICAIHVINGVAVVDKEKCRACGACVEHCPRHLIELVPYESRYLVRCASKDKGKLVMQACEAGCIGCKKCQRECPSGAVYSGEQYCTYRYFKMYQLRNLCIALSEKGVYRTGCQERVLKT